MELFALSLLPLVAGPLLVRLLQSVRPAARLLDSFVIVSVGGLVFVHILPHTVASGGALALGAAAVGLLLPVASAKVLHARPGIVRKATLLLGLLALSMHAALDGVALAAHHQHGHDAQAAALAFGVVLHRLPVGVGIWSLVRKRLGLKVALLAVGCIALTTTAGYFGSHELAGALTGRAGSSFQALVAGSVVHVVAGHRHMLTASAPQANWRPASACGALLAIGLLVLLSYGHNEPLASSATMSAGLAFFSLALQSAPALIVAYLLTGLLHAFIPERPVRWLQRGSAWSQTAVGTFVGAPLSVCSCGVLPLYRGLVQRGVPAPAAIALLVAAPEIGVASVLLSFELLGVQISLARIAAALALAFAVGLWIGQQAERGSPRTPAEATAPAASTAPLRQRLVTGLRHGFGDVADHTLPWFVVGVGMAALAEQLLDPTHLAAVPWGLDVPLAALAGLPLYVCASGSTPLAAVLVHKGLSAGGAVTFVLAGAATNVATFGVLSQLHGRALALRFGLAVALLSVVAGLATNVALGDVTVPIHETTTSQSSSLQLVSLFLLAALLLRSLFRQGAEGFVAQIVEFERADQKGHTCACADDGCHEHDHHDHSCAHHTTEPTATGRRT